MTESCYPYESFDSGVATSCKIFSLNKNKIECPTGDKMDRANIITSGAAYPVRAETPVIFDICLKIMI